jgi:hypothetical protein
VHLNYQSHSKSVLVANRNLNLAVDVSGTYPFGHLEIRLYSQRIAFLAKISFTGKGFSQLSACCELCGPQLIRARSSWADLCKVEVLGFKVYTRGNLLSHIIEDGHRISCLICLIFPKNLEVSDKEEHARQSEKQYRRLQVRRGRCRQGCVGVW